MSRYPSWLKHPSPHCKISLHITKRYPSTLFKDNKLLQYIPPHCCKISLHITSIYPFTLFQDIPPHYCKISLHITSIYPFTLLQDIPPHYCKISLYITSRYPSTLLQYIYSHYFKISIHSTSIYPYTLLQDTSPYYHKISLHITTRYPFTLLQDIPPHQWRKLGILSGGASIVNFPSHFFALQSRRHGSWASGGAVSPPCRGPGGGAPGSSWDCAFSEGSNWLRILHMWKLQSTPVISNTVISNFPLSWTKPFSLHFSIYLSTQIRPVLATPLSRTFRYLKQNFFPVSQKPLRL